MNRRHLLVVASGTLFTPAAVLAQERFVDGQHFMTLSQRQPTRDPKQVEVLEFFAYGCDHCNRFEPALDAWQKRLPPAVLFRRIPVAFRESMVIQQRLYFALESLGLVEQLHRKVFHAIHAERQRLDKPQEIAEFVARNGADAKTFMQALDSFSVATKAKQASALASGYKIEGTPSIGVDGRWLTSGSMAGSNERSLAGADYLLGLARRS
jgi:thiol:disulfide interchange protein DsbA